MARAMACEMRAQGLTVLFAPDLDVIRDPRYGRCEENFGEDPYLVGQMGRAVVRGLQGKDLSDLNSDHTVVALLRAYPGMGDAEGGHDFTRMGLGRREMQEVVLRPWREAIEEGAQGVMAERAEYDGDPAPASTYYLNDLLREEWGFEGITIGDAGAVRYLISQRVAADKAQAAAAALRAGLDQNLSDVGVVDHSRGDRAYGEGLPQALERGLITSEDIDRSVRRVLRLKFLLGLFENPYVDPEQAVRVARCAEHCAVSLEAARQSIVLLKNDHGTLPLAAGDPLDRGDRPQRRRQLGPDRRPGAHPPPRAGGDHPGRHRGHGRRRTELHSAPRAGLRDQGPFPGRLRRSRGGGERERPGRGGGRRLLPHPLSAGGRDQRRPLRQHRLRRARGARDAGSFRECRTRSCRRCTPPGSRW